jgi:protein SCO1/2
MALSVDTTACQLLKNKFIFVFITLYLSCHQDKNPISSEDALPFYNSAEFDAEWIAAGDSSLAKIHTIDTFTLVDQLGHKITSDSLKGKIYVANFFFTSCPGICPKMMNNLESLQDSFLYTDEVKLISFSVMPWADSVSRLKAYGEIHHIISTKWHLLTGAKEKIYTLGRKSYFAEKGLGLQKDSTEFLHTESMLLIDRNGRIRGIYNATQRPDLERVTEDIRVLLKEK